MTHSDGLANRPRYVSSWTGIWHEILDVPLPVNMPRCGMFVRHLEIKIGRACKGPLFIDFTESNAFGSGMPTQSPYFCFGDDHQLPRLPIDFRPPRG